MGLLKKSRKAGGGPPSANGGGGAHSDLGTLSRGAGSALTSSVGGDDEGVEELADARSWLVSGLKWWVWVVVGWGRGKGVEHRR
jgi:hypothetical protein